MVFRILVAGNLCLLDCTVVTFKPFCAQRVYMYSKPFICTPTDPLSNGNWNDKI